MFGVFPNSPIRIDSHTRRAQPENERLCVNFICCCCCRCSVSDRKSPTENVWNENMWELWANEARLCCMSLFLSKLWRKKHYFALLRVHTTHCATSTETLKLLSDRCSSFRVCCFSFRLNVHSSMLRKTTTTMTTARTGRTLSHTHIHTVEEIGKSWENEKIITNANNNNNKLVSSDSYIHSTHSYTDWMKRNEAIVLFILTVPVRGMRDTHISICISELDSIYLICCGSMGGSEWDGYICLSNASL